MSDSATPSAAVAVEREIAVKGGCGAFFADWHSAVIAALMPDGVTVERNPEAMAAARAALDGYHVAIATGSTTYEATFHALRMAQLAGSGHDLSAAYRETIA